MQAPVRRTSFTATLLAITLCWNGFAHAAKPSRRLALLHAAMQQPAPAPSAGQTPEPAVQPVRQPGGIRERLSSAHTVLLTETGNDPAYALSRDDTFNSVLDALNKWGRYAVTSDVNHADLVIQLHGAAIATETAGAPDPITSAPTSSVVYSSSLQVTVADPHTLAPLWVFNLPVQTALRQKSRTNNIALLGQNTVSQLKLLTGDPLTRQEQAQLKQANNRHLGLLLGLAGAGFGLTLGLFFLSRHAAQQSQASFCQQHGISPCPGA